MSDEKLPQRQRHLTVDDLPDDRAQRRAMLVERYGVPKRIHAAEPLRLLDLRDKIHPSDVIAYVYPSIMAFNVYSGANLKFNDFPSLGPLIMSPDQVIGVLDYRAVLPVLTDPSLPDDAPSASSPHQEGL